MTPDTVLVRTIRPLPAEVERPRPPARRPSPISTGPRPTSSAESWRRSSWWRSRAEPQPPGDRAPYGGTAAAKATWDWALASSADRRSSPLGRRHQHPGRRHRPVRAGRQRAGPLDVSSCACASKSRGRVASGPGGPGRGLPVAATGDRDFGYIYHVGGGRRHQPPGDGLGQEPGNAEARLLRRGDAGHRHQEGRHGGARRGVGQRAVRLHVVEEGKARVRSVQVGLKTDAGLVEILRSQGRGDGGGRGAPIVWRTAWPCNPPVRRARTPPTAPPKGQAVSESKPRRPEEPEEDPRRSPPAPPGRHFHPQPRSPGC